MPFPTPQDFEKSDQELIQMFLSAVENLLREAAEPRIRPEPGRGFEEPMFEDELVDYMRKAFEEIPRHFNALSEAAKNIPESQQEAHGLKGIQLRFKLAVVSTRERAFRLLGGYGRFQWLLDTLEGLLDSIIDASGTGGAIKEYKEAVRNAGKVEV